MTQKKQQITIILPESVADMPVRVVRGKDLREIIVDISPEEENRVCLEDGKPKYAFVWEYDKYRKVTLDELEWIEADESYSVLHLSGGGTMTLSCTLSTVGKELPPVEGIQTSPMNTFPFHRTRHPAFYHPQRHPHVADELHQPTRQS